MTRPREFFINWQNRSETDRDGRYFVEASNVPWPTERDGNGCFKVSEVLPEAAHTVECLTCGKPMEDRGSAKQWCGKKCMQAYKALGIMTEALQKLKYDPKHLPDCACHSVADKALQKVRALIGGQDEDPSPWCSGCKAKKKSECSCGPLADNE